MDEILKEGNDPKAFGQHFRKVYLPFFVILKEQYPHLTENELRLCTYWI